MINLPHNLKNTIEAALHSLGVTGPILNASPVSGGCINNARRVSTGQGDFFLKWNDSISIEVFEAEAHGLRLLESANAIRVPKVLAVGGTPNQKCPPYLLLEWLSPETGQASQLNARILGEQLAYLHQSQQSSYGLERNNFIGPTPQINCPDTDWVSFFRDRRLLPQLRLASIQGNLPEQRLKRLETLLARLDTWLGGVRRQPSLLHGDLWSGNVIVGPKSEPVLIDPAVYYGDREAEIAYTELFGGFGSDFYRAYESVWPLEPDYSDRRDIYNLYHLLNHLNLFGESYGYQVDIILRRYVG